MVAAVPLGIFQGTQVPHAYPLPGDGIVVSAAGVQDCGELLCIPESGVGRIAVDGVDFPEQGIPVLLFRQAGHEFVRQNRPVPGIEVGPCEFPPVLPYGLYAVGIQKCQTSGTVVRYTVNVRFPAVLQELQNGARPPSEITDAVTHRDVARIDRILQDETVVTHETGAAAVLEITHRPDDRQICQIRVFRIQGLGEEVCHARPAHLERTRTPVQMGIQLERGHESVEERLSAPPPGVRHVVVRHHDPAADETGHICAAEVAYPDKVVPASVHPVDDLVGDLLLEVYGEFLSEPVEGDRGYGTRGDSVGIDVGDHLNAACGADGGRRPLQLLEEFRIELRRKIVLHCNPAYAVGLE